MKKTAIKYVIFLIVGMVIYVSVKLIKHNLAYLNPAYDIDMVPLDEAMALIVGAFLTGWCIGKFFDKSTTSGQI